MQAPALKSLEVVVKASIVSLIIFVIVILCTYFKTKETENNFLYHAKIHGTAEAIK